MNLIPPGTNHPTGNYFCTWGIQNAIPPRYGLVGTGCSQMRDTMTAAHLFDGDDFHPVPRAERSGLYFLLDDGWDVPMGTRNPEDSSRMGRMVPDPEKFAALGDTDDARLRAMVQRAADLGYAGLGLWVSPQRPDRPGRLCRPVVMCFCRCDSGTLRHTAHPPGLPCLLCLTNQCLIGRQKIPQADARHGKQLCKGL